MTAENTRFELVRGCPQHAFQLLVRLSGDGRRRPDLRWSGLLPESWTALNGGECNQNCNQGGGCRCGRSPAPEPRPRGKWQTDSARPQHRQ
jgi:hypothetical protein